MRSPRISQGQFEHVAAGWVGGCNSSRFSWLLADTQYPWGINVTNRGGILQTRPGYAARLSLPSGKRQGLTVFTPTREGSNEDVPYFVFAIDGVVYAIPVGAPQPSNWGTYKLDTISFDPDVDRIYFESAEKSLSSESGVLTIVPTYSTLMIQDGKTAAAYWDGTAAAHLDESSASLQTPIGTLMKWSGNRLWVVRGKTLLASDLLDPYSFRERVDTSSDFQFDWEITGLANSSADTRQASLIVFTENDSSVVNSAIQNRTDWVSGENTMVSVLYPSTGCISSRSIISHAGLLWWYSAEGLVNSDIAAATYLTSQLKVRDVEMSRAKRDFSDDLSTIAAASFENMLLVAVPAGDSLNAQTMVLDYSIADELSAELPPAWCGVWTGIRPVEFVKVRVEGVTKLFALSVDYFDELDNTENRIWELFQADRRDSYEIDTVDSVRERQYQPIFCEVELKSLGDGMDVKKFSHAEIDAVEIGGSVELNVAFAGTLGSYQTILDRKLVATLDPTTNTEVSNAYEALGGFNLQGRRVKTENASYLEKTCPNVESVYNGLVDRAFSLRLRWCGRLGVGIVRFFLNWIEESSDGACEADESGVNALTKNGVSIQTTGESVESTTAVNIPRLSYTSPFTPKYASLFYSSVPIPWEDLDTASCVECARTTSTAPTKQDLTVDGKGVY
jgi:hypothetical protein